MPLMHRLAPRPFHATRVIPVCGIVAVARPSGVDPLFHEGVGRMTDALMHRGPDAGSVRVSPDVVLGHRRLSILDLAAGAQPMSNEDGSVCVVFNGEIYNHDDAQARTDWPRPRLPDAFGH